MKKLCLVIAFACVFTNGTFAAEPTQKHTSKRAQSMMAQFLSLLASIAIIISAKDKEQRLQAAAQILSGLASVAHIFSEKITSSDETDKPSENPEIKRACTKLFEQEEFMELCHENRAELRTLLIQILTACQEEELSLS